MKKNKLLLLALAPLVLAGCGEGNAAWDPTAEPEVEKTLTAKEAAPTIKAAAKSFAETKGLGFKVEGYAKADVTIKTKATEGITGLADSYQSTVDLSGIEANVAARFDEGILKSGFAASADFKAKLNANLNLFAPDTEKSTESTIVMKDVKETVNSEVSATASYEENVVYADLTGFQPLNELANKLSGYGDTAGIEIDTSSIFSKIKVTVQPGIVTFMLPMLPSLLGGLIDGMASSLESGDTQPGENAAFKKYKDGTYGTTVALSAQQIADFASTFTGGTVEGMDKINGTLNTLIVFSEKGLISVGLKENFSTAEFAPTTTGDVEIPVQSVSATSDAGLKLTFTTGDDVTVNKVTDKSAYKDITPATEEE